jgi:hypothetical protein
MKFPHPMRRKEDKPERRLRRGLYILPSLFTSANIAAGYYALVHITQGSLAAPGHFDLAAKAIGFAVVFDSLDGSTYLVPGDEDEARTHSAKHAHSDFPFRVCDFAVVSFEIVTMHFAPSTKTPASVDAWSTLQ